LLLPAPGRSEKCRASLADACPERSGKLGLHLLMPEVKRRSRIACSANWILIGIFISIDTTEFSTNIDVSKATA
jgi:hypothetical protein